MLRLRDYEAIRGVDATLAGLAEAALAARLAASRRRDDVLVSLLQLVTFDGDRPVGRYLDGSDLPVQVEADLDAFVDGHLLTTGAERDHAKAFTVRHRGFLTAWPPLREKIEQEREVLQDRNALAEAARMA